MMHLLILKILQVMIMIQECKGDTTAGLKVWGDLEVTGSLIASASLNVTNARLGWWLLNKFRNISNDKLTCSITPTQSNSSIDFNYRCR